MVISQPAVLCLAASQSRLTESNFVRWLRRWGRSRPTTPIAPVTAPVVESAPEPPSPAPDIDDPTAADVPLTAAERRARAAALRGLLLARQRRFQAAEQAFAQAIRLDPELDLATVPTFWDLERSAHEAVVRAYDEAGQGHRAAVLAARLQERFRPRLVRRRPDGIAPSPATSS